MQKSDDNRLKAVAHLIIIAAVTFAAYYNSLGNGFVGDDNGFVRANMAIRSLGNSWDFFFNSSGTLAGYDPQWGTIIYRPLRTLSYAIDYAVWGLRPFGFHLTNLILHMAASVTFYIVILGMAALPAMALAGGLLFAMHPVHIEAVSWIASRGDIIGMVFLNLSLIAYMKSSRAGSLAYLVLSLAMAFVAYLGKETFVSLPGVIILYDFAFGAERGARGVIRKNFLRWALFAAVTLLYLVFRFKMTGRMSTVQGWWGGSAYSNFLMMAKATAVYLRLMVLPVSLNFHYVLEPVHTIFNLKVLASLLVISASLAATVYFYFRNRLVFFSLAWFYVNLVPIANIIPNSFSMMAERYIYMPMAGPLIAAAALWCHIHSRAGEKWRRGQRAVAWAGVAVAALFSLMIIARNRDYRDEMAFYLAAVRSSPLSAPSYKGLADQYADRKGYAKAIDNYERAIAIDPGYAEAFMGEAVVYKEEKAFVKAVANAERAAALRPGNAVIRYTLGNIYREAGEMNGAVREWLEAVRLDPGYAEAYNNLGVYYQMMNDFERSAGMYGRAISSNPYNAETYYNLATLYEANNRPGEARANYLRFVDLAGSEYGELVNEIRAKWR